ncbi:recombinase family protein [Stieleria sp. TO1_6]|uniref:recombinase family protein n=1 Tax=Stieleria tagensis TaxID=2956795 RepID=UPI00209BAC44|nr:recombinase family protein [Stieleria tagensis]MCO8125541.1 recombinase family protein [Stieleria tagensis]
MKKFIAYYRVSTDRQGRSGLGLEAQTASVRDYVASQGELIFEYTEVETGKRADRPQLTKALAHARRINGTLVIAKLDRLARNVAFTATLMESGTDFLAVDNPSASKLTIHVLAAVAEAEAQAISMRTKEALKAYKARGGKLGSNHPKCRPLSQEAARRGQWAGVAANQRLARDAYAVLTPHLRELREAGKSYRQIASALDAEGHTTRQGRKWNPVQVKRVLDRSRKEGSER